VGLSSLSKNTLIVAWSFVAVVAIAALAFVWIYTESVNQRRLENETQLKNAEVAKLVAKSKRELSKDNLDQAEKIATSAMEVEGATQLENAVALLTEIDKQRAKKEQERVVLERLKADEEERKKREQEKLEEQKRERERREAEDRKAREREAKDRQEKERLRIAREREERDRKEKERLQIAKERENTRRKILERFIGTWDYQSKITFNNDIRSTEIGAMIIKWGPKKQSLEIRFLESRFVDDPPYLRANEVITPTLLPDWKKIYTAMPDLYYWGHKDSDFYRPMGVWNPELEEFNYKGVLNNGSKITTTLYFSDNGNRFDLISPSKDLNRTFTAKRK
jgi:hypothetical protein